MNFLLYMLGRAAVFPAAVRPTRRQSLLHRAARAAAAGDWDGALVAYRTLADAPGAMPLDALIRAHLHLVREEPEEAALHFSEGLSRLYQSAASYGESSTAVERLLNQSNLLLTHGRYPQAAAALRRARSLLEILLAAEAGLLLAQPQAPAAALQALARLSDLTLRLLARGQVAQSLAGALRQRRLRADLAPWATSTDSVQALLAGECDRLHALAAAFPAHAQTQHRLGLIARAAGRNDRSADAFGQVLALHPHHVASAVRLALADPRHNLDLLRRAFLVPAATMRLFAAFGAAAAESPTFDAVSERLCRQFAAAPTVARGNLAFALSELALLDESRETWHEPALA